MNRIEKALAGKQVEGSSKELIKYFLEFYGPKGLYKNTIPKVTKEEIKMGILFRGNKFEGDSADREIIRDLILKARDLK